MKPLKVLHYLILLNLFLKNIQGAKRRFNLEFENYTCQAFSKRLKQVDCHFEKLSNDHYVFTESIMFDRDMGNDFKFRIWIDIKRRSMLKYIRFFDVKVDACNVLSHSFDQQFLNMVVEEMKRTSNLPRHCPFKANTLYKMDNFSMTSDFAPVYTPECMFIFGFDMYDLNTILSSQRIMGSVVNK